MQKRPLVGSLAACSVLFLSASMALAGDNWLGTWKLNPAKSMYTPGPAPRSQTLKFEKTADGTRLTTDGVNAEGKEMHGGYVSKWDGKDVPFTGNPDADTSAPKRIDDDHYSNTWKKGGKVTVTVKAAVSAQGKVLTVVETGKDAQGRPLSIAAVFDKQ